MGVGVGMSRREAAAAMRKDKGSDHRTALNAIAAAAPTMLGSFGGDGMAEWDGGWGLIGVSPYFSAAHRKLLSVVVLASLYQHRNIVRVKTPTQHRSI